MACSVRPLELLVLVAGSSSRFGGGKLLDPPPSAADPVRGPGAKSRTAERLDRLRALRADERKLRRPPAPIRRPVRGKAPWNIAVSMLAQVIQTKIGVQA